MSRDEMLRLWDAGDFYGLVLAVNAAFAAKYHPGVRRGTMVFELGDGSTLPIPIIPCPASSSPPPRPLLVPSAPRP